MLINPRIIGLNRESFLKYYCLITLVGSVLSSPARAKHAKNHQLEELDDEKKDELKVSQDNR